MQRPKPFIVMLRTYIMKGALICQRFITPLVVARVGFEPTCLSTTVLEAVACANFATGPYISSLFTQPCGNMIMRCEGYNQLFGRYLSCLMQLDRYIIKHGLHALATWLILPTTIPLPRPCLIFFGEE